MAKEDRATEAADFLEVLDLGEKAFKKLDLPNPTNRQSLESFLDLPELDELPSSVASSLSSLTIYWYGGFCTAAHEYLAQIKKHNQDLLQQFSGLSELPNPQDFHYGLICKELSGRVKKYGTAVAIAVGAVIAAIVGSEIADKVSSDYFINNMITIGSGVLGALGGWIGSCASFRGIDNHYWTQFRRVQAGKESEFYSRVNHYIEAKNV